MIVSSVSLTKVVLNETDTVKSVCRNVANIMRTPQGTVAMYREFGSPVSFLDKPIAAVSPIIYAHLKEEIEKWEPRCRVNTIRFEVDPETPGKLIPTVDIDIIST